MQNVGDEETLGVGFFGGEADRVRYSRRTVPVQTHVYGVIVVGKYTGETMLVRCDSIDVFDMTFSGIGVGEECEAVEEVLIGVFVDESVGSCCAELSEEDSGGEKHCEWGKHFLVLLFSITFLKSEN